MARARAERPKMSLSVRNGNYCIQFWDGKRARRVSCRTTDEATARRFLATYEAGYNAPPAPPAPTIGGILDGYREDRRTAKVAALGTIDFAIAALKRHLGDLEPGALTKERCRFYAARRRAEGYLVGPPAARRKKAIKDGTIIRELLTLRAAFGWAVEARWLTSEPYVEVPSSPPPRDRWLTREEAQRLIESCSEFHVLLFTVLALTTAARHTAILTLRTSAVDVETRRIDYGAAVGNKRRNRSAPIHDDALPLVKQAIELSVKGFLVEYAGASVRSVKTGFAAACRRAGLVGVTPHILRHTAATWMAQGGVSMREISGLLGCSEDTAERVYAKHSPEHLRNAVSAIGRIDVQRVVPLRRKKG